MNKIEKAICLASFCATDPQSRSDAFDTLLATFKVEQFNLQFIEDLLRTMDMPRLLRRMGRPNKAEPLDWAEVTIGTDNKVYWRGKLIGEVRVFYKTIFPQETQACIAYEVFLDRFLAYVQREYKVALLRQGDADVTLLVPQNVDFELKEAWDAFVGYAFSTKMLRRNLGHLMNTIKLVEREPGGFGFLFGYKGRKPEAVIVPSIDFTRFISSWYYAVLEQRTVYKYSKAQRLRSAREGLRKWKKKANKASSPKQRQRAQQKVVEWEDKYRTLQLGRKQEEDQNRRDRFEPARNELKQELSPQVLARLESDARFFTRTARRQFGPGTVKPKGLLREIKRLEQTVKLRFVAPIIHDKLLSSYIREPGDDTDSVCYACGRSFPRASLYKAHMLVINPSSQRTQSSSRQVEPPICPDCYAIGVVSPIKIGGNSNLVIRLRGKNSFGKEYLLEDHLRMLAMGELDIVAGRYAMVRVIEQVPGKGFLPQSLGRIQYALYKVATLFPPEVFYRYQVEALIGNSEVPLPGRHLTLLNGLTDVFNLGRWWENKRQLRSVGQAIRYVQKEEVISGVYTLIQGGLLPNNRFYSAQSSQLESLYEDYWRWLMKEKPTKAQRFRDVAAMTGLLYAFCSYTRSEVQKAGGNVRIEVRKLIDRATEPFGFTYTAAGNTKSERATLYRNADSYFCFDQAKALLKEMDVDAAEREGTMETGTSTLTFYFDDVTNAYTYLFENRYPTLKEQRDFTNVLRMSLHSRFPELIERERGE